MGRERAYNVFINKDIIHFSLVEMAVLVVSDMQFNFNYKPLYKSDKQIYTDTEIKRINDNIIKKFRLKLITTETAIKKIEENSTHVQIEAEKEFKSCMKRIENLTDFVGDRHKK